MPKQQLDEKMINKGGVNGDEMVADPVAKNATLPNSKDQGEKTTPLRTAADLDSATPSMGTGSAASNKASIDMKASDASAETVADLKKFSKEDFTIEVAFEGEELSEEFKEKAVTIFEAAVKSKIAEEIDRLEEEYKVSLDEETATIKADLVEKVDGYLNYVLKLLSLSWPLSKLYLLNITSMYQSLRKIWLMT